MTYLPHAPQGPKWPYTEYSKVRNAKFLMEKSAIVLMVGGLLTFADSALAQTHDTSQPDASQSQPAAQPGAISVGVEYIGEVFSAVSGGAGSGTVYEGRADLKLGADLDQLFAWRGAQIQMRLLQIHNLGNRNAADLTSSLADPSNIDAVPTTRLFTAWIQQDLGNRASLRVGQLAADDEFFISPTAGGLLNGTFGWPTIMSSNLPSGGPAYPLAAPGARIELTPREGLTFRAAAFSGDPGGAGCYRTDPEADPQLCNRHGMDLRWTGGTLWLAETEFKPSWSLGNATLPGEYRIGAWYHTGRFVNHRAAAQVVQFDPNSETPSRSPTLSGNWGIYATADQTMWQSDASRINVFARIAAAPHDRNTLSWYVDGGVGMKGIVAGRPDDQLTIGIAYSHISSSVRLHDQRQGLTDGQRHNVRSSEVVFEIGYLAQITPSWSLNPDIQYIVRPGGGITDATYPDRRVRNALIAGVRSVLTF